MFNVLMFILAYLLASFALSVLVGACIRYGTGGGSDDA